ncbi:MAG: hypothetical protein J6Y77_00550 [Paludibacteraceae bacterium]|nr:hypothetical protein [Paludibacteraceae bacterium]
MQNKKLVVVVPVYRPFIEAHEAKSLESLFRCFGQKYPVALVAPEGLDATAWTSRFAFDAVERFDDRFFEGIAGYNRLMTDAGFYARFADYDYLLICQSDVYVFFDGLDAFVQAGYDYVGAPWVSRHGVFGKMLAAVQWGVGRVFGPKHKLYRYQRLDRVGNGGFSLRRVQAFQRFCSDYRQQLSDDYTGENEDVIFATLPRQFGCGWLYPTAEEALGFAFDLNPQRLYQKSGGKLPMAAHAWHTAVNHPFWQRVAGL